MAQTYWSNNYWNSNYWNANYWGNPVVVTPVYWHPNYWGANYWNANYWANDPGTTQNINQTAAPQMTMTAQVSAVDISLFVSPNSPTMTMTGQQAAVANSVAITPTVPTMTMTGIDTSADTGEYYVADVNFTVFMSSNVMWTDTINATAPTMTMTANPTNVEEGGSQTIGVTSTPTMTLSPLVTGIDYPIVVTPLTPQMTMTAQNVTTGFGTLVNAQAGSMTMTPIQASVVGVNADINEIDATIDTMMMSGLNATVIGSSTAAQAGGHFIPGLAGITSGKKRPWEAKKKAKRVVESIVREELEDDTKPVKRVSRKRKQRIIERSAKELGDILAGDAFAVEKAAATLSKEVLEERRENLPKEGPRPLTDSELEGIALELLNAEFIDPAEVSLAEALLNASFDQIPGIGQ